MSLDAREIAVRSLRDRDGNISAHLDRLCADKRISSADRGLAMELTLGVVRRRRTLEAVTLAYLKQPDKKLPSPVREILYVAIYQILFLDRVPAFAAVDQAVRQTVASHHKRQGGLVNGLLRNLVREMSKPLPTELSPEPAVNLLPLDGQRQRRLGRDIFCDPKSRPAEYLAEAYSLPIELAERWLSRFDLRRCMAIASHSYSRPPLICRVNRLRGGVESAIASLADDGINARQHENAASVILESAENLTSLQAFADGLIQPQDATATAVVAAAEVRPGMRVLDFCAAPGTKTTHLAERMENRGTIIASDVSNEKIRRIEDNCRRMGVDIVQTISAEQVGSLDPRSFDLVLADVPCSNTGVLARRPEARWRFNAEGLSQLVQDQQFLAEAAGQFVAPGGQLIYSTCSIEPEEGSHVATSLAKRAEHLRLASEKLTIPAGEDSPTQWHDGGYVAIFRS